MKILMVVDKVGSAIYRMALGVQKYNPHLDIDILDFHPKRPDVNQIEAWNKLSKEVDVIDFEYWKTYTYIRDNLEIPDKPKMLVHHNPYNIFEENWREFKHIVVLNDTMKDMVRNDKRFIQIRHTIDLEKFPFNREYQDSKKVIMVAARIEDKKGILEVAQVCKKLGLTLILVGSISKKDYFDEVMATGVVEFREKISDKELYKSYCESAIHICNSIPDFESGTLPILEAMAIGVPVLTTNIGQVPDLYNSKNMVVRKGNKEDINDLQLELGLLMKDLNRRLQIREDGWGTAKVRDDVRRAREYEKLWIKMFYEGPLVSVIVPTFNRKEILLKVMESIIGQDYPAIELVICDDGSSDGTGEMIEQIKGSLNFTLRYINTGTPDEYNLAKAKNLGVIEAIGEILLFVDDRYELEPTTISKFVSRLYHKKWLYGSKDNNKRNFIENFSCIYRQDFINAGMFNEFCKLYGFQSQELRSRFKNQGFKFEMVDAEAKTLIGTKNKYRKKDEIRQAKNILYKLGL